MNRTSIDLLQKWSDKKKEHQITDKSGQISSSAGRRFWTAKCHKTITQLEYGALTYEEFLDEMVRLGWDQQDVEELLEEEDE